MPPSSMKILCHYQYDPLDRLVGLGPLESLGTQRFYQKSYLANEIEDQVQRTIIRNEAQPLAQRQSMAGVTETTLLATDQQHSVLKTLTGTNPQQMAYTAYGHHPVESGLSSLLGFNGERADSITGHYPLGQGNRAYNPVLMRFSSPDNLSPFGEGGINSYAYCGGDPINFYDPTGNIPVRTLALFKPWNFKKQLHTIQRSSTIARSNQSARNPLLNEILNTPITTSSRQPRPSTSTLLSQELPLPAPLSKTQTHMPQYNPPSASTERYQARVEDGLKYDRHVENHPNFKPVTTKALQDKWELYNKQALESERTTPKLAIAQAKQKRRKIELEIKQYNIRQLGNNAPT